MELLAEEMTEKEIASAGFFSTRWPEWLTLSFYATIVAAAIPFHEPWADEAQAWQLARNLSLPDLFKTYLRHEDSPGFWHLLLWFMNRMHIGYTGMHWISAAIAVLATSILVFASPFPRYLKLTLPFTSFLLFQYALVARSYSLVPLLLFLSALCWKRRPLLLALTLGLLGNTALHSALISGGIALVYTIQHFRTRESNAPGRQRRILPFLLLVSSFYAFAIWTAWPSSDLSIARHPGESRSFLLHGLLSLVWGMCEPWILSIPFWVAIVLWFRSRKSLLFLLPILLFVLFSSAVYANWWHVGLLVPTLITLLWITWPSNGERITRYETIGRLALLFMIATQILWSGYALAYDHYHAYSPDRAAAEFLKPFVNNGKTIAITYIEDVRNNAYNAVGILPYFDKNIYVNLPNPYWFWTDLNPVEDRFNAVLPSHPDIVIVEQRSKDPIQQIPLEGAKYQSLLKAGYKFTNLFCGTLPERLAPGLTNCHVIFQFPVDSTAATEPAPASAAR